MNFSEYQNVEHCPPAVNRAVRTVKEAAVNELMRTNRTQRAFVNPTYHAVKKSQIMYFSTFSRSIFLSVSVLTTPQHRVFGCFAANSGTGLDLLPSVTL